jgi:stage V sporulation protein AA
MGACLWRRWEYPMNIYVKLDKKANITGNRTVLLRDVAEVFAESPRLDLIKKTEVFKIKTGKKASYLITAIDVAKAVSEAFPGYFIQNVGESDTIIEYSEKPRKNSKLFEWAKVVFVSVVLLAGSTTAIMSFQTDSQIPKVFKNYYYIFFHENIDKPHIIDIPYSIGMAVGIIVFFNHISKKKLTDDPTPIEVELTTYETQANDTIIDTLSAKRKEKDDKRGGAG